MRFAWAIGQGGKEGREWKNKEASYEVHICKIGKENLS